MSKNLEAEYKKIIDDQIPDLWDRIEAGLENQDKGTFLLSGNQDKRTPLLSPDPTAEPAIREVRHTEAKRRSWRPFIGIAAAAACVCLIVPFALSTGSGKRLDSSVMTAEATAEEAAFEPAVSEDNASGDFAVPESAAGEYAGDASDAEAYYDDSSALYAAREEAAPEEAMYAANKAKSVSIGSSAAQNKAAAEDVYTGDSAMEEAVEASAGESEDALSEDASSEDALYTEAALFAEAAEEPAREEQYEASADTPGLLTGVTFEIAEVPEDLSASGALSAVILSCPGDPSLEGSTISIIQAGPELLNAAGLETAPELPAEAGVYTGSLIPAADADGAPVYALYSL